MRRLCLFSGGFAAAAAGYLWLLDGAPCAAPYEGAKPHYILDIENRPLLEQLLPLLAELTPLPKRKKA